MDEVFLPIKGYEDSYYVSNLGRVWSCRSNKILKPATSRDGYHYYVFCVDGVRKTKKEHRLVAEAFIPNELEKPAIDHINGIRTDNRADNLRWVTNKENTNNPLTRTKICSRCDAKHMREIGSLRNFGRHKTSVYKDGKLLGVYPSLKDAAAEQEVNYSKASEVAHGKRKTAGGLTFAYEE